MPRTFCLLERRNSQPRTKRNEPRFLFLLSSPPFALVKLHREREKPLYYYDVFYFFSLDGTHKRTECSVASPAWSKGPLVPPGGGRQQSVKLQDPIVLRTPQRVRLSSIIVRCHLGLRYTMRRSDTKSPSNHLT